MEKLALRKSDSMYFDVLKEIGNIGTGNATTSISTMLDMKVNMQVPDAELIAVQDLNTVICSEEEEVVCIYIRVHNGTNQTTIGSYKSNAKSNKGLSLE